MRDRHAMYFVRLVERSEGALTGHGHLDAQTRLDREQDNCRAALQWLLDRMDAEPARRMAGGLGRFWFFRGYVAEGEGWFERVLALPDSGQPTIGRARCIYGLGRLALSRADYAKVVEKIEAARELYRELGDTAEERWALFCLGFVARARGDYPRARALLEQGLEASRASRNGTAEANCLWSLAEVANDLGDDQQARAWAEAGLARATEVGWLIGVTVSRRILERVSAGRQVVVRKFERRPRPGRLGQNHAGPRSRRVLGGGSASSAASLTTRRCGSAAARNHAGHPRTARGSSDDWRSLGGVCGAAWPKLLMPTGVRCRCSIASS